MGHFGRHGFDDAVIAFFWGKEGLFRRLLRWSSLDSGMNIVYYRYRLSVRAFYRGSGTRWGDWGIPPMRTNARKLCGWVLLPMGLALCVPDGFVQAAVISTTATVSTIVQELIDGVPGSISSDENQLAAGAADASLQVEGSLLSTDLDGALVAMAQGFSDFLDPSRLDQPNPEEFGLEVAGFANGSRVAYTVDASSTESRTILFTTPGNPLADPEITFGPSGTQTVESRVFISGAVIFWSTQPGRDLTGMSSELSVSVTRDDNGVVLFSTTLDIIGDGTTSVGPTRTGALVFEIVTLDDLREDGVDDDTLAVLEQVETTGSLLLVVIPPQEHAYTYTVSADQPIVLTAALSARIRNMPDGTGVAATLGRPFENLVGFIEEALPGVDGAALQESVNAISKARSLGLIPMSQSIPTAGGSLCGAMGAGSLALLGLGLAMLDPRLRR